MAGTSSLTAIRAAHVPSACGARSKIFRDIRIITGLLGASEPIWHSERGVFVPHFSRTLFFLVMLQLWFGTERVVVEGGELTTRSALLVRRGSGTQFRLRIDNRIR